MLPWQKIVAWLSSAVFVMLVTWGTWVTISMTTSIGAQAETDHRLSRVEMVIGSVLELKADIRVLSAELRAAEDQLKHRVCYEQ